MKKVLQLVLVGVVLSRVPMSLVLAQEAGSAGPNEATLLKEALAKLTTAKQSEASSGMGGSGSPQLGSTASVSRPGSEGIGNVSKAPALGGGVGNQLPSANSAADQAFTGVINTMLPMTAAQIATLRKVYDANQLAAATLPGVPPKPTSSSLTVDLNTGAPAPVVRLCAKTITSLILMDTSGQPWPISYYSIGDPNSFDITWQKTGHLLMIQPKTFYNRTNLVIKLEGLDSPVIVDLITGQQAVDYRVDLRIPKLGPNAGKNVIVSGLPSAPNEELYGVLSGIAPNGTKVVKVSGNSGNTQAWISEREKKLYLRTNLNIVSPGYSASVSNGEMMAYLLPQASQILAWQRGGKEELIKLKVG